MEEEARLSPLCLVDGGVGLGVICVLRRVGVIRGAREKIERQEDIWPLKKHHSVS